MELSKEEQQVLGDRQFFMVKAILNDKLDQAFSSMKATWMEEIGKWPLPGITVDITRGKIFRGENYKGFPYTLMDYPRAFSKTGVFAVRTMCWWGNEFSFTLHLQGAGLLPYAARMEERLAQLNGTDVWCSVAADPWQYEFQSTNYRLLDTIDISEFAAKVRQKDFLKIAYRIPLEDFNSLEEKGKRAIRMFGKFLSY